MDVAPKILRVWLACDSILVWLVRGDTMVDRFAGRLGLRRLRHRARDRSRASPRQMGSGRSSGRAEMNRRVGGVLVRAAALLPVVLSTIAFAQVRDAGDMSRKSIELQPEELRAALPTFGEVEDLHMVFLPDDIG